MIQGSVFKNIPDPLPDEFVDTILERGDVRIERIVSRGHRSSPDFWCDQEENEWVMVLTGHATIAFDDGRHIELEVGDYIDIPAHVRHRVHETSASEDTVWLAVFYSDEKHG